ncbi:MAG: hypothetical protein Q7J12_05060, partial [Syntrophales bacterium]|nr:hypothetical protein [Syntrophales bacterium]
LAGLVDFLGPAVAPIAWIRVKYRWQLFLKSRDIKILHAMTRDILARCSGGGLDIKVDVDPVNFM